MCVSGRVYTQTYLSLLEDLGKINLSKYVSEAVASIVLESKKMASSDVKPIAEVCMKLHLMYADFGSEMARTTAKCMGAAALLGGKSVAAKATNAMRATAAGTSTSGNVGGADEEPWVMKSMSASLCAEVIRAEGQPALAALLPEVMKITSVGPMQAGIVCLVLKTLAEEVMVYNEGLEADRLRSLFGALTNSLPTILPAIYSVMDSNFVHAQKAQAAGSAADVAVHLSAVEMALAAAAAYAEWAPMLAIHETRLISAAGHLIQMESMKMAACEFVMQVASRKRAGDGDSFNLGIRELADALIAGVDPASLAFQRGTFPSDEHLAFLKRFAEALNAMASNHFNVGGPLDDSQREKLGKFLFVFSQHPDMAVASVGIQSRNTLVRSAVVQWKAVKW